MQSGKGTKTGSARETRPGYRHSSEWWDEPKDAPYEDYEQPSPIKLRIGHVVTGAAILVTLLVTGFVLAGA